MKDIKKQKAKHGGHNPDNVLLGMHVTPTFKAIAKLTANKLGKKDVTEFVIDDINTKALSLGIIDNKGKVTPEYELDIKLIEENVRSKKRERQNNGY